MRISVIGTGYVGLVTGACLAGVGHEVCCVDKNEDKIKLLKQGGCPIFEPTLEEYLHRNVSHDRLTFSTDIPSSLKEAECVFIAVGTPENEDGSADMSHVFDAAKTIGQTLEAQTILIVKSTVPVGSCDQVERIVHEELEKRRLSFKVPVLSNPEFLKEGSAVEDFMKPERIIVGGAALKTKEVFEELYQPFISENPAKLIFMDRRSSELTKYAANAMLATRITFMNELSMLCDHVKADIEEIRRGLGSDSRIGEKFLKPGPGYGGSCFPKDVEALIKTSQGLGFHFSLVESVKTANEKQKYYALSKIKNWMNYNKKSSKIALWGLAFKPGTDDVRESPSLVLVKELLEDGHEIHCYDPRGMPAFTRTFGNNPKLFYHDDAYGCLQGSDCLVLATDWPEFKRPNWQKVESLMHKNAAIFDFRNLYVAKTVREHGFHYECLGRPTV